MDKVSASKIVGLRVAKAKARAKGFGGSKKGDGDSQLDLFEAEGGRRYSRQYVRSNEEELRRKRKGGGKGVLVKGKNFASRSEAGRYAANMRWRGHSAGLKDSVARDYKTYDELSPDQKKKVSSDAKRMGRQTGLVYSPETYYKENAGSYDIRSGVKNPTNYDAKADRPLARDKANAKSIVKGFQDRLKLLSETPSGRVPKEKMREAVDLENRAEGGRQILAADSQSKAKYIIEQLDIMSTKSQEKARYFKFRANENLADKPRFSNLARNEFGTLESLESKYGGAVEVYEALYDTQLDR